MIPFTENKISLDNQVSYSPTPKSEPLDINNTYQQNNDGNTFFDTYQNNITDDDTTVGNNSELESELETL